MSDTKQTVTYIPIVAIAPEEVLSRLQPYIERAQELLDTDPQWREKADENGWSAGMLAAGVVLHEALNTEGEVPS